MRPQMKSPDSSSACGQATSSQGALSSPFRSVNGQDQHYGQYPVIPVTAGYD